MKHCPSCGDDAMIHKQGIWACLSCGFSHSSMQRKSRKKQYLERIDRIGARLSNVRW